jgi:hypothetical protein
MQFSAVPATCQMLTFYQFNIQRRHSNICGMSSRHKADSSKFNEFSEEEMSSVFQEKLKNAVAHQDTRDAKYVFNKLLPVLAASYRNTSFRALERNSSLGQIYAMIRRFGPEIELLLLHLMMSTVLKCSD